MRFNQPAVAERFAIMAEAAGVARGSSEASANAFVEWLTALKRELKVPAKLGEVKVTRAQLPRLIDVAIDDICHKTNPRECTRADFEQLFAAAL